MSLITLTAEVLPGHAAGDRGEVVEALGGGEAGGGGQEQGGQHHPHLAGAGLTALLGAGAGHTAGAGRGHTQVSITATWADTQTKEWAAATLLRMPSILMSAILALGYHYHLS